MTQTQHAIERAANNSTDSEYDEQQDTQSEQGFSPELASGGSTAFTSKVTPNNILSLQRSIGNQAVQRMIQRQRATLSSAIGTIQRDGAAAPAVDEEIPPPPPGPAPTEDEDVPPPPDNEFDDDDEVPLPPPPEVDESIPPPPSGPAPEAEAIPPPPPGPAPDEDVPPAPDRPNYNADTGQDYSEYGTTGTGVVTSLGGAASKSAMFISPAVASGSAALESAQIFGAGAGIAGVVSGGMETVRGIQDMSNSGAATGDRVVMGGGRAASGLASMAQQGGSAAYNIASLTSGVTSSAAVTGAAVAGGGGVAMGAVDMVRGGYGVYKARQRQNALNNIASDEASDAQVKSAAVQAASTQEMRKKVAGATVLKGALLVAGGVTLLVLATNPVGWILMGAGAVVGGLAALWRFWQKSKRKKQVAIRELGLTEQFAEYEKKKAAARSISRFSRSARNAAIEAVKNDNPLHKKMVAMGYGKNDYAKFYADYIHDTAHVLHMNGVILGNKPDAINQQMRAVLENMGLKVNPQAETPTAEQIAKALNN